MKIYGIKLSTVKKTSELTNYNTPFSVQHQAVTKRRSLFVIGILTENNHVVFKQVQIFLEHHQDHLFSATLSYK